MKKIDIITKAMTSGGAERVIAQLANYFIARGICCRIIATDDREVMYSLNEKVKVVPIGKKSDNKIIDRVVRYSALRKVVLSDRPDVVLTMPEDTGIYVILALSMYQRETIRGLCQMLKLQDFSVKLPTHLQRA